MRLGQGPEEIACTSLYLDEAEWGLLLALPTAELHKQRRRLRVDGRIVAVDVFAGHCAGLVTVEIDGVPDLVPETAGLPVVAEVTADERCGRRAAHRGSGVAGRRVPRGRARRPSRRTAWTPAEPDMIRTGRRPRSLDIVYLDVKT